MNRLALVLVLSLILGLVVVLCGVQGYGPGSGRSSEAFTGLLENDPACGSGWMLLADNGNGEEEEDDGEEEKGDDRGGGGWDRPWDAPRLG